ncbi:MAG TPA: hypothetical protein PK185_18370 [Cyclobacteriaceae bacterium]|nr:hypothetical protein [Cyclobacteriaceae bacterium]
MVEHRAKVHGFGFEALKALDSNGDGKITAADAAYSMLELWQDLRAIRANDNTLDDAILPICA